MTATLANIITSLRLIEMEDNGPRTKMLLGLAARATQEQQTLIRRILGVFEDELSGVYGRSELTTTGADGNAVLDRALDAAAPLFAEKGVRLERPPSATGIAQVPADPIHLERVVTNLLENALERTPAGGAVVVRATEEPEALIWQVEDSGSAIDPDVGANLFVKWDPTNVALPSAALRLHFCRIVVENCGGEIGCTSLPTGGNCFSIRLTKNSASA
jgi:signal transduction histidine kinase